MEKEEAREIVRRAVGALSQEERSRASHRIVEHVTSLDEYVAAKTVMLFLPMKDEVDTWSLVRDALDAGKRVAAPRVSSKDGAMHALRICDVARDVAPGAWGIPEPVGGAPIPSCEIDLILVPGVAFDRNGRRLGRGAGFYDRFLGAEGVGAFRCAVAFACQIMQTVPTDAHDLPVDCVVTEREIIYT